MRIVGGEFSTRELAEQASTPERAIAHTTASVYIGQLVKAGYVVKVKAAGKKSPRAIASSLSVIPVRVRRSSAATPTCTTRTWTRWCGKRR